MRSSLTICLWAISGERSSRNCGGLPEKMCTCRALCIFGNRCGTAPCPVGETGRKGGTRTEEALFVLSLFDDRERGYEVMHTQLSYLFTQNRTLSLVYDFGVLEWFIRFYAEQAKKYRGKLTCAAHANETAVYEYEADSREFSVLTKAGYRCDEIILANSLAVWADRLPDRLSSKSITAEKIATACGMLLNAPKRSFGRIL